MPKPEKQRPALSAFYSGVFFSTFTPQELESLKTEKKGKEVEHVD